MKKLILLALVLVSLSAWAALVPILPQNFTTNAGPLQAGSGVTFVTNANNTITIGATGGGTLTAAQATNIVFTNSAILLGSPAGGGSIYNNMRAATPLFTGQGLLTWNGNKQYNLWFANSTTTGSYSNAISFRAGIKSMGPLDQDNNQFIGSMDPTIYATYITVSDNPARWDWTNRTDDTGLFIGSGQTYGSGESINFLTVITNALTGVPIVISTVDNEIVYNQTNSRALGNTGLLPGFMGFQQNLTLNSLGSYAGRVGGVGADTGNHAGWLFDMTQKRVWFPKWVDSVYVPTDVGFVGSYADNISGDFVVLNNLSVLGAISNATVIGNANSTPLTVAGQPNQLSDIFQVKSNSLKVMIVDSTGKITGNAGGLTNYQTASTSVLGVVKVDGTSITINGSGVISSTGSGSGGTNMVPVALSFSGGTNVAIVGTLPTGAVGEINYNLTLTTNAFFQVPSGTPVDGQRMIVTASMDAVGTWNILMDTNSVGGYKGGIDLALPLPNSTNALATDIIGMRYNLAKNKWLVTSHVRGY